LQRYQNSVGPTSGAGLATTPRSAGGRESEGGDSGFSPPLATPRK